MSWNNLSMKEKAAFIKVGVKNGLTNIDDIQKSYNKYAQGGPLNDTLIKPFSYQQVPEVRFNNENYIYGLGSWLRELFSKNPTNQTTQNIQTLQTDKHPRVRENDSPTKEYSTILEDGIHKNQLHRNTSSEENFTPYIIEKEVKIPKVGRTSTNVFDSLAVYAPKVGVPMKEAVGLFGEETVLGGTPNFSMKAQVEYINKKRTEKGLPKITEDDIKDLDRASQNASVFRNFGGMYSQFLFNDHEWDDRGWEKSPKYKAILHDIKSPYEHALTMYKLGLYNKGDKNHKLKVQRKGDIIVNSELFKAWQRDYDLKNSSKK